MPVDRLFHPRAGHSQKVSRLTDLAFRVWWTYQLAADDFGVLRRSPIVLQSANVALAQRPRRAIDQALDTLVTCGLLLAFEDQGERFVCQATWQDFQKIRYPRETLLPLPPPAILEQCSGDTAALFLKHSRKTSGGFPSLPRAGTRETATANGFRLTASGKRPPANGSEEGFGEEPSNGDDPAFAAFWELYPKKVSEGEARVAWQTLHPTPELAHAIVEAVRTQRTDPNWTKEAGRWIPKPANWLNGEGWKNIPTEVLPAAVSTLTRQNRANAEEAKRLVRESSS